MIMRLHRVIALHFPLASLLLLSVLAGCSTPRSSEPDWRVQSQLRIIDDLGRLPQQREERAYLQALSAKLQSGEFRTNGSVFVPAPPSKAQAETQASVAQACETILADLAADTNEVVREQASMALARLGTTSAWARALVILTNDPAPEVRAAVGGALAQMLAEMRVADAWARAHPVPTNDVLPFLRISHVPVRHRLVDADADRIGHAIAQSFLTDDGAYAVHYVDKIPWVPFSRTESVGTNTVREAFVEALRHQGSGIPAFAEAVKLGATSTNRDLTTQSAILLREWSEPAP
jgi:hypothetical protein